MPTKSPTKIAPCREKDVYARQRCQRMATGRTCCAASRRSVRPSRRAPFDVKVPPMPFKNLGAFLAALRADGDLQVVDAEVDPEYEVGEIAQRAVREGKPALLFT